MPFILIEQITRLMVCKQITHRCFQLFIVDDLVFSFKCPVIIVITVITMGKNVCIVEKAFCCQQIKHFYTGN